MKKILLSAVCSLMVFCAFSQNTLGLPQITNYNGAQFNAGTQTWGMAQDKKGIIYFANNNGLVAFNGKYSRVYTLPNNTIVRSVAVDTLSGKIYVGGQDEMGYFLPNERGELVYTSLKQFITDNNKQFADIWTIVFFDESIFFRAADRIYVFKDNHFTVYGGLGEWSALATVSGRLLAQNKKMGLVEWKQGSWESLCPTGELFITSILEYNSDTALITTYKNGSFLLQLRKKTLSKQVTSAAASLVADRIYCAQKVNKRWFALGTTTGGCYIMDINGAVIQRLTKTEGIQNNNILSLFLDRDQNLWMGLDNGIDFIAYNSAIKHIFPDKANQPSGYAVRIFDQSLYIGTSNGLYSAPLNLNEKDLSFSKGDFTQVQNTTGQVWGLGEVNKQLLLGHHEGAYVVNKNVATPLGTSQGSWLFMPLSPYIPSPDILIGNYNGLELLNFSNNRFSFAGKVDGTSESFRFLAIDNNIVWTSHPYRGVFKIILSPDKKKVASSVMYDKKDGLPSNLNNYVFKIKNRIVVATEKGVYEYNATTNRFVPSDVFSPIFKESIIRYLTEDDKGNIWFVGDYRAGVVDFQKPSDTTSYSIVYFPELTGNLVYGFIHIYPYDQNNVFIGGNKGVYHINYNKYKESQSFSRPDVLLGQVKAVDKKDSIIYGGYSIKDSTQQGNHTMIRLPNHWNSFHFEYSSTLYAQISNIEFSYQLLGFDKGWSDWSFKTEKDYTNLPYGVYTFKVKARNSLGTESEPVYYTFEVLPAWYQTIWAYLFYCLVAAACAFALLKYQKKKFAKQEVLYQEEQKKLRYLHQLELDRNEKEIMKLQNDNLETEVHFKNKELATVTMHLVERGKLISKLKDELMRLLKYTNNPGVTNDFKGIMRMLAEAEKSDDDWEHFAIHFDQVHSNFLTVLKARFPGLSSTDLKLCAYLRINLSSKEIAQLMNISLKGIEVSRYRLRKKLQIGAEVNLYDFLIQVTTQEQGQK